MKDLVGKLAKVEQEIADERGGFSLFALFLREDVENKWDVVVSAPWFGDDQKSLLDYLVQKIQAELGPEEMTMLSRIVLVEPNNVAAKAVNKAVQIEHGVSEVLNSDFFGLRIKQAYIITSKDRDVVPAPAAQR